MNLDLGFRVLRTWKRKIFKIIEPQKPHNRLLTSIKLLRQFNPH